MVQISLIGLTQSGKTYIAQALCRGIYSLDNDKGTIIFKDTQSCIRTLDRPIYTTEINNCEIDCTINYESGQLVNALLQLTDTPGSHQGRDARHNSDLWLRIMQQVEDAKGIIIVLDIARAVWDAYRGKKNNEEIQREINKKNENISGFLSAVNQHSQPGQQIVYCISKVDGQNDEISELYYRYDPLVDSFDVDKFLNEEECLVETDVWSMAADEYDGNFKRDFARLIKLYDEQRQMVETESNEIATVPVIRPEEVDSLTVAQFKKYIIKIGNVTRSRRLHQQQMYDFFKIENEDVIRKTIQEHMKAIYKEIERPLQHGAVLLPVSAIGTGVAPSVTEGTDQYNIDVLARRIHDMIVSQ